MTVDDSIMDVMRSQKDALLRGIDIAEDAKDLDRVLALIALVASVWLATPYAYKVAEVKQRFRDRAKTLIREEGEFIARERKNSRHLPAAIKNLAALHALVGVPDAQS